MSKNKKVFSFRFKLSASGESPPDPRPGALPLDPAGCSAPDPRAFAQLQICHYTTEQNQVGKLGKTGRKSGSEY